MSHSRWLTSANQMLRFYTSAFTSFKHLKTLAYFIVNMFPSTCFDIKCQLKSLNCPKHWKKLLKGCSKTAIKYVRELVAQKFFLLFVIKDLNATKCKFRFRRI